eukprot:CAMPEP_0185574000 /NCGR_PEP_ID=MMETSP0434-20130131/5562_1 /TAXON_ID=626734 ORGANISM="Favella taraikaensis, Strain Fe Narragansett Bay" /NCGR_SAMPLE_ID=MMETSP0434 /ASSEMBLY_ACC=CAM_ASM_000379 /LENGTH=160 /DNA_ID=CAMNT_0028190409 /DNA_START=1552 /DNA_END=2034 /DNA_ORIENTATION=+
MKFYEKFARFLDLQSFWQAIKKEKNQIGLAKVVESIFDKPLCKGEQMSNWEKRPLRKSQQHYGALDAVCLVQLLSRMEEKARAEEHGDLVTVELFTRELIYGKKLDLPDVITDPNEKKEKGNKKDRRRRKRGPRKKRGDKDDENEQESDSDTDANMDSSS